MLYLNYCLLGTFKLREMDLTRAAALKPCGIEFSFAVVIVLKDNEGLIRGNCGFENSFRWF